MGQWLQIDGHTQQLAYAFEATRASILKLATVSSLMRTKDVKKDANSPSVLDMPLVEVFAKQTKVLFDIVTDFEGSLDVKMIHALMKAGAYDQLPEPLRPKEPTEIGRCVDIAM